MSPATRFFFNNVSHVLKLFATEFADYAKVILDIPAVHAPLNRYLNPLAASAACDAVLLVCGRGMSTEAELKMVVYALREAGCNLTGTVLRDVSRSKLYERGL